MAGRLRKVSLARAVAVGVVVVSVGCAPTVSTPTPTPDDRVWAFGDSNGVTLPNAGPGWADLLGDDTFNASRSGLGYANLASTVVPGTTSERGDAARWFQWAWASRAGAVPQHVVVSLGLNDLIGSRTAADVRDGVRRLLSVVQSANQELIESGEGPIDVWILPVVPFTGTAAIHNALQPARVSLNAWLATEPTAGLVDGPGAPVVRHVDCNPVIADPTRPEFLDPGYLLPFDDNHFNADGRTRYAQCIVDAIAGSLDAP